MNQCLIMKDAINLTCIGRCTEMDKDADKCMGMGEG